MSRAQTKKQQPDFSKPIIKIESSEEFFKKENEENGDAAQEKATPIAANGEIKKKNSIAIPETSTAETTPAVSLKKNEIIIPVIKPVEDPLLGFDERIQKKRKLQNHYIRFDYCNPKPSPHVYEWTDKDQQFVKETNEKLPKPSRGSQAQEITMPNFAKTIEAWENATERGDTVPPAKAVTLVESYYSGILKDSAPKVYDYWKKQREVYQRPLLRAYLSVVNENENNPNAAFRSRKTRETRQINTRRPKKVNDAENLEKMKALKHDLNAAVTLLANIKYREMMKLEIAELEMIDFEASLKEKPESKHVEKWKQNYETDSYLKLRKKMADYDLNIPYIFPKPKPEPEEVVVKPPVQKQDEELNFDLGCFIASVLDEALSKDITLQKVQTLDLPSVPDIEKPVIPSTDISIKAAAAEEEKNNMAPIPSINKRQSSIVPPIPEIANRRQSTHVQPPKHRQQVEERLIEKFRLQRRIGRQRRVLFDRIFEEEENGFNFTFPSHPKEFYPSQYKNYQPEKLITPEISQKLNNSSLQGLYIERFGKFRDIWPYNDSDEENETVEASNIKSLANNFKSFVRQQRPVTQVT